MIKYEYCDDTSDSTQIINNNNFVGQEFRTGFKGINEGHYVDRFILYMSNNALGHTWNLTLSVEDPVTHTVLVSKVFSSSLINQAWEDGGWVSINLSSSLLMTPNTDYLVFISTDSTYNCAWYKTATRYNTKNIQTYIYSGGSWSWGTITDHSLLFQEWGHSSISTQILGGNILGGKIL
jgi:hypothetical protein